MTKQNMENYEKHLYVVILCGGTGTRVWPLSINKSPKQFLNFYSQKTLYQGALTRAKLMAPVERILIITNQKYIKEIYKQSPEIPKNNIIGETEKKNTAMAMGVAASLAKTRDKDAVLINLPSDHVVKNNKLFAKTLKTAASVAFSDQKIATVGIVPTYAHPGFGYIKFGKLQKKENDIEVYPVDSFKEKPSIEVAQKYLDSGNYLWNAGFYIWRADVLEKAFNLYSPEIGECAQKVGQAIDTKNQDFVIKKQYSLVPEEPIDTAVSEKADNLVVLPGKFDWNDVGSWQVVYELGEKDENGNVKVKSRRAKTKAPTILEDTKNSLVYSNDLPIAVVGLKNIVVVDTGKGILVCDRKKSNDVKKIVQKLKDQKMTEYL